MMLPNTQELVLGKDYTLSKEALAMLETIKKQMYDTKTRTCQNRDGEYTSSSQGGHGAWKAKRTGRV